jgi:hypothetical protein
MPLPDTGKRSSRLAAIALGLAILGAASMVYYEFGFFIPRVQEAHLAKHMVGQYLVGQDIYPVWLTTREWLAGRVDPYSPAVTREIQVALFGRPMDGQFPTDPPSDYRTFAYPAFTDLILWPATTLPFRILRMVWIALLVVLLVAAVFLWTQTFSWRVSAAWFAVMALLTVCSYPELEGLSVGQLGLFVGFLLAASLWALQRGRQLLAGLLMALTTIKPQMTLLAILYLVFWSLHDWRRRWRFSMSFLGSMFLLTGASLAVWPHWISSWAHVLLGYRSYTTPPLASQLLGFGSGSLSNAVPALAAAILALALTWHGRAADLGSQEFWLTLCVLLGLTSITVLAGQSLCDDIILLPGILWLAHARQPQRSSPIFRRLRALGLALLLWPWAAALGLIGLRPFLSRELFRSKDIFILPVRTASTFPFMVLFLLSLALWIELQRAGESASAPQR